MSRYLVNGTEEDRQEDPRRRVKAFVDLHSYGQLCEWLWFVHLGIRSSADTVSHVPICALL